MFFNFITFFTFYCSFLYLPAICWQRIAFEFRNKGLALVGVGRQRYILEIDIELIEIDIQLIGLGRQRYILENKTNQSLEIVCNSLS